MTATNLKPNCTLKIVDLDDELTCQSSTAPGLRHMYLRLSDNPPNKWIEFFDVQWRFPRHTMWRSAWIDGNHIVVDCVPEELKANLLPYLNEDVAKANSKYGDYLIQQQAADERQLKATADEKNRLQAIKRSLTFN